MNCDHLEEEPPMQRRGFLQYTAHEVSKPVHMAFDEGFRSALHEVLGPDARPISHTSSYAQDGCVDYVFFRSSAPCSLEPADAALLPSDLDQEAVWSERTGWGEGHPWAQLSD